MKPIVRFFCLCFVVIAGCGPAFETSPPTQGDFVSNVEGHGSARVWGITFDVEKTVGSKSGSSFDGTLSTKTESSDARVVLEIGDDVTIQLEKQPQQGIVFSLNGRPFGELSVGDKVEIDASRQVRVNAQPRTARDAESSSSVQKPSTGVTTAMSNPVTQFQIIAKDPEKAAEFYQALFGWTVNADNAMGYRQIETGSDEGITGGIWPAPPEAPGVVQLFVTVDDVAASVDQATSLGGQVIVPTQTLPDGDTMAVIQDPQGITFGLVQRRKP